MHHASFAACGLLLVIACKREADRRPASVAYSIPQRSATDSTARLAEISSRDTLRFVPNIWAHYGTETPSFCLIFHPDSTGQFVGGFEFYNPIRWSYRQQEQQLLLTVPGIDSETVGVALYQLRAGRIVAYDSLTKTMVFKLTPSTTQLTFMGYNLTRSDSMQDFEYDHARGGCPAVLPPRTGSGPAPN